MGFYLNMGFNPDEYCTVYCGQSMVLDGDIVSYTVLLSASVFCIPILFLAWHLITF